MLLSFLFFGKSTRPEPNPFLPLISSLDVPIPSDTVEPSSQGGANDPHPVMRTPLPCSAKPIGSSVGVPSSFPPPASRGWEIWELPASAFCAAVSLVVVLLVHGVEMMRRRKKRDAYRLEPHCLMHDIF